MTRKIFDEPTAHRKRGLQPGKPEVAWFTKVSRPDAAAGRRLVNELFALFPDQSPRMRSRLHSEDDSHLLSALDELFVYDLLAKRYTVGYEEGDGKHPDFHLYHGDEYVGRVEVLTLLQRDEWSAEERRHADLVEHLNQRLPLTTHSVIFDIQRWGNLPSVNDLAAWLSSAIAELAAHPGRARQRPRRCASANVLQPGH